MIQRKKNSFLQSTIFFAAFFMIMFSLPLSVHAADSISVAASSGSVTVNKEFTVTVTISTTEAKGVYGSVYFTYDTNVITFVSGDNARETSAGKGTIYWDKSSKTGSETLTFKAKSPGNGKISFTTPGDATGLADIDNRILSALSGSKTVTVTTPATPTPTKAPTKAPTKTPTKTPTNTSTKTPVSEVTPTPTPVPTPTTPTEPSNPLEFTWKGTSMRIAADFNEKSLAIPSGYQKTTFIYNDIDIYVLQNASNGLILFYATDADGGRGAFYLYQEESDTISMYSAITVPVSAYTMLMPGDTVNIPSGFTSQETSIDEQLVTVWKSEDAGLQDYYLIYAVSPKGEVGFYLYDITEGTILRCPEALLADSEINDPSASPTASPDSSVSPSPSSGADSKLKKQNEQQQMVIMGSAALCLALGATSVTLFLKGRKEHAVNIEPDAAEETAGTPPPTE